MDRFITALVNLPLDPALMLRNTKTFFQDEVSPPQIPLKTNFLERQETV